MIKIPNEEKKWVGMFPGFYAGNLWQTFNIDLERSQNRLRLSDKFRIITDGDDAAAPGLPYKFLRTNADNTDRWWCLSSSKMLVTAGTNPYAAYTADGLSSSPTDAFDMETHEDANGEQRLAVTRATDISILNRTGVANAWTASWWVTTLSQAALNSTVYHPLIRLQRLLIIGDREKIHTIDQNDVVSNGRLVFAFGFEARCICKGKDRVWIGLQNNFGGQGKIAEWDGFSLATNNEYPIIGAYPLSSFVINDIPYFIDEFGLIYKFTGGGFDVIQQFPIAEEKLPFTGSTIGATAFIHPNGIAVNGKIAYILVGAPTTSRRMRSGIWVFNSVNRNLYHLRGIGQHKTAGTDIDYGQTPLFRAGGISFIADSANTIYDLLIGAGVYKNYSSTTKTVIGRILQNNDQSSNGGRNRGYFITPYIPTSEIEAMWEGLWVRFKRFVNSNNRIIAKYRVIDPIRDADENDESVLQASGTWVSTTTFTCVVPTGITTGMEVEVLSGDNAGCSFNISALSATPDGAATITVTIDEAAPTSSTNIALMRFDNFLTLGTISLTTIGNQKLLIPRQAHGEFIQLKIELRGFGVEIDELIPLYQDKTLIKQK